MYSADYIIEAKVYLEKANDSFELHQNNDEIYFLEKAKQQIDLAIELAKERR